MLKAGVIGYPIAHSKSPLIHGYWLKQFSIDGEYKTYDIAPDALREGVQHLIDEGLSGFNVTIPHKQAIMNLCASISDEAQKIGAVNTVVIDAQGKLHGYNTDCFGFTENLKAKIPAMKWDEYDACVIGAGGAARAIIYALAQQGVKKITLTNRTRESAETLAQQYGAEVCDWDKRDDALRQSNLIINTTSLGMKGQPPLEIASDVIHKNDIVYDIVYAPLMTPLLQQAKQNSALVVTGIGMLLHQARPGFQKWFGDYPDVTDELEKIILA